ncbi:MAG: hypothetical protein M3530_02845 [Thermoproteota archaeon]|nr:hypothetical protein [Thermoproteota archaeon]
MVIYKSSLAIAWISVGGPKSNTDIWHLTNRRRSKRTKRDSSQGLNDILVTAKNIGNVQRIINEFISTTFRGIMRVKDWDIDLIPVLPVILISGNLFLN